MDCPGAAARLRVEDRSSDDRLDGDGRIPTLGPRVPVLGDFGSSTPERLGMGSPRSERIVDAGRRFTGVGRVCDRQPRRASGRR